MPRSVLLSTVIVLECAAITSGAGAIPARKSGETARSMCAALRHPTFEIIRKPFNAGTAAIHTIDSKDVDLSFQETIDMKGDDVSCVKSVKGNFVMMENGDVYEFGGIGYHPRRDYLMTREKSRSPFAFSVNQTGPMLKGHKPDSVAALDFSSNHTQRIGVWTTSRGSTIALFDADQSDKIAPSVVGITKMKLRDVNYFPAPDAPIGDMTIVHDVASDHVEIFVGSLRDKPFVR